MATRRPDYQLTQKTAEKIVSMLEIDDDTLQAKAAPTEVCQEIGIDRRTFNSVVSKAIFAKSPTKAQTILREHLMEIVYVQTYCKQEQKQ